MCDYCDDILVAREAAVGLVSDVHQRSSVEWKLWRNLSTSMSALTRTPPQWALVLNRPRGSDRVSVESTEAMAYSKEAARILVGSRELRELCKGSEAGCQTCSLISKSVMSFLELHHPGILEEFPQIWIKAHPETCSRTTLALVLFLTKSLNGTTTSSLFESSKYIYVEVYTRNGM